MTTDSLNVRCRDAIRYVICLIMLFAALADNSMDVGESLALVAAYFAYMLAIGGPHLYRKFSGRATGKGTTDAAQAARRVSLVSK